MDVAKKSEELGVAERKAVLWKAERLGLLGWDAVGLDVVGPGH